MFVLLVRFIIIIEKVKDFEYAYSIVGKRVLSDSIKEANRRQKFVIATLLFGPLLERNTPLKKAFHWRWRTVGSWVALLII
jgi:hypothetical protein